MPDIRISFHEILRRLRICVTNVRRLPLSSREYSALRNNPMAGGRLPSQMRTNRFDRMEWAGAFGDLGTLIPFVVAYVAVVKVDPFGLLFSFGAAMVICGLYYKTPSPFNP